MQHLNCDIGDLAIVVRAEHEVNIGLIVTVTGNPTGENLQLCNRGHIWQVRVASGYPALHYFRGEKLIGRYAEGPAPDKYLRRLAPSAPLDHGETLNEVDAQIPLPA